LKSFDWSGTFGFGSGTDFEKVNLPVKVEAPITAIAADDQDLWLGTDGGGLIRVPQSGAAPTMFNEKDGFPMSSIRSLLLMPGRLLIGFGRGMDGSFGCLDANTLKFTGTKPSGITLKAGEESLQPPPRRSVSQIKTPDGTNTFWIACDSVLYRLKFDSQEWSLQLPSHNQPDYPQAGGLRTLSPFKNYVATIMSSGGVAIYKVSVDRWTHLNLSTNRIENDITTLAIDLDKPNYLWLGGHGKITILDMDTQKIVCEYRLAFHDGAIEFLVIFQGDIFFIEESSGSYELFHWDKPKF
jgi:ligand-binding sensor domain-containing protein